MHKRNLICTKTAVRILSVSPRTLENYRQSGIGPSYIKLGKDRPVLSVGVGFMDFKSETRDLKQTIFQS